jgi:hypothetical protein
MILVTINKAKRLLYLTYIGQVHYGELQRTRKEMPAVLADLPPDINVLADLERMDSMDASGAKEIGMVMEMLDEKGVNLLVRVIPDPSKDIGLSILSMFHYRKKIRTVTCQTMEEAFRALAFGSEVI